MLTKGKILQYRSDLREKARELRLNVTFAEKVMWRGLRRGYLFGCKFRRQVPIGKYIVDFYCHQLKLIIELDGDSHFGKESYDKNREDYFKKRGFTILYFNSLDVVKNNQAVIDIIAGWIKDNLANTPQPPSRGE